MRFEKYRHTDGLRRWELLFEGFYLVLLKEDAPKSYANQLLAFDGYDSLVWSLSPHTEQDLDHIANIWIKDGCLYAGSYSDYSLKVEHKTGEVIAAKFTK